MKYLFLIILIMPGFYLSAQEIKGKVVDKDENGKFQGLPGASVYWEGTTEGVGTELDGTFQLKWNRIGKLVVSYMGYDADTIEVKNRTKDLLVVLSPSKGEMLDEINVEARKTSTVLTTRAPIMEQLITGEELCKAACCNLGESFTTNASVDVSYTDAVTGAKQIQLLGLTGKYVQMMTENMPNFRGVSSIYGLNYVPGPWMSAISVSKGVGSVINGYEAIAGQVSVDYKKPRVSEKIFVNGYVSDEGMVEFNANAGILLNDKWSTALLLHHDRMQEEHTSHGTKFLDMPKQSQYNLMNRWEYKTDTWNIQFGGKFLDEERLSGEKGFKKSMKNNFGGNNLYGIGIDTRRYEGFVKAGYLMPQYENSSMALILNYTDHTQDAFYGAKNYNVTQRTFFGNYIFQSAIGNTDKHQYSAGVTFNYDKYDEEFNDYLAALQVQTRTANLDRSENTMGAFFQYTGHFWDKLTVMGGLRYDYNSRYDGFVTPRLHIAYTPDDWTIFKVSAGSGARAANILADNSYLLASGHSVYVNNRLLADNPEEIKQLDMEKAWNFGVLLNRKFFVLGRVLNVNLDYYRTQFTDQVVVDIESDPNKINFYNLDGDSYSNCYQAEVKYELIPRLDFLAAIRYNDVKTTVGDRLLRQPLQSKYKGLLNLSYATNMRKWQFDFTTQFNGGGRMPASVDPGAPTTFKSYEVMNAQVSKFFRKWSIYAGCENIGNFTQDHPILGTTDPWGEGFDASKVWGPVHGRKFYLGVRFGLDRNQ